MEENIRKNTLTICLNISGYKNTCGHSSKMSKLRRESRNRWRYDNCEMPFLRLKPILWVISRINERARNQFGNQFPIQCRKRSCL